MAIYHFSLRHISRGDGRSSTGASAYRGGLDITDERTGERFNYANKGKNGVLDHAILAPSRAPEWAKEASSLWNAVEAFENRKDSRVATENILALPHVLTLEQNRELVHGYVKEAYVKRGAVAQADIHAPDKKGDHRNIHAHILTTTRQITRNGFKEKKPRNWNEKATLLENRKLWEKHVNRALERAGHSERVDHRSFKEQGIEKMPSVHMGVEATAMERRGEDTRQGEKNRAVEAFNQNLDQLKEKQTVIDLAIEREKRAQKRQDALLHTKQQRRQNHQDRKRNHHAKNALRIEQAQEKRSSQTTPITKPPETIQQRNNARYKVELRQREELYDFESKMVDAKRREQDKLDQFYKPHEHKRKLKEAQRQLDKHQGMFSKITGKTKALKQDVEDLKRNLESLEQTRSQSMSLFTNKVSKARHTLTQRHKTQLEEFDRKPLQKTGTAKSFEKAVLTKEVANQNREVEHQSKAREEKAEPKQELTSNKLRVRIRDRSR